MGKQWTYSGTKNGYAAMWASLTIKGGKDDANASYFAKKILANSAQYKSVQAATGVPWYFIGALHMRESSCSFAGVLHNGDKIIGTGKLTYRVPAGRGPFSTWSESAIDALNLKGLSKYRGQWCPSLFGFVSENFNGLGNVARGVNSAYLWAGSNHEQLGKYVRDHVFDPNFDDPQIGTMTVIKRLCEMSREIAAECVEPKGVPGVVKGGVIIGGATAGAGGAKVATDGGVLPQVTDVATSSVDTLNQLSPFLNFLQGYGGTMMLVLGGALIVGTVAYYFWQKRLD